MSEDRTAPVKEGEKYDVFINSVGGKGDGIAKVKGFVLFIANTKKDDYVQVKVTKVLANAGFAEVVKKLEKPERKSRARKFETISKEEFQEVHYKKEYDESIDDTDNFGDDLDEE
jgi:predicted RNA-binding protein with TRAM domain